MTNLESMQSIEERLTNLERINQGAKTILTLEEVAKYTNYSKSYIYKLTSRREIPCYKPNGKQLYFKRTGIDEWLLTNRKMTNKEIESEVATKSVLQHKRFKLISLMKFLQNRMSLSIGKNCILLPNLRKAF